MKSLLGILTTIFLFSSCVAPYSRMTSPEIMPVSERSWTLGLHELATFESSNQDITYFTLGAGTNAFEIPDIGLSPFISYRAGSSRGGEWGLTLDPLSFSVIGDYKHRLVESNTFFLSGDASIYLGTVPGLQYDLLIGNSGLYGQIGVKASMPIFERRLSNQIILAVGTEFNRRIPFGIQLHYSTGLFDSFSDPYTMNTYRQHLLSLGLKYDIRGTKKRYRK
jgi:hypothetical protein